jgi:hypothetical protein
MSTRARLERLEAYKHHRDMEYLNLVAKSVAELHKIADELEKSGVDYNSDDVLIMIFKAY